MTEPAVVPVKPKRSVWRAVRAVVVWAFSPAGRKDLGAVIATVTAVYTAFHRAGL